MGEIKERRAILPGLLALGVLLSVLCGVPLVIAAVLAYLLVPHPTFAAVVGVIVQGIIIVLLADPWDRQRRPYV